MTTKQRTAPAGSALVQRRDDFGVVATELGWGSPDPYIDECPAWCEYAVNRHEVESNDTDRNTRHREPTIWIGKGESSEGVTLTVAEAAEVARTLPAMVEAAHRDHGPARCRVLPVVVH